MENEEAKEVHENEMIEDSDSEEDIEVQPSDELCVSCKIQEGASNCELNVFCTERYNLYTHHDSVVGELSTCMIWIDRDPKDFDSTEKKSFVAVAHMNGEISIWNLLLLNPRGPSMVLGGKEENSSEWKPKSHTDSVLTLAWNKNTKALASGSVDGTVKLWNISTGECAKTFECDKEANITALDWHPREVNLLLVGLNNGNCIVINTQQAENNKIIFKIGSGINCARWNVLNPACFLVATDEGKVVSHDVRKQNGDPVFVVDCYEEEACTSIVFNRKKRNILMTAGAGEDQPIIIWQLTANGLQKLCSKILKVGPVLSVDFASEDHPTLILAGGLENIAVWDLRESSKMKALFSYVKPLETQGVTTTSEMEQSNE